MMFCRNGRVAAILATGCLPLARISTNATMTTMTSNNSVQFRSFRSIRFAEFPLFHTSTPKIPTAREDRRGCFFPGCSLLADFYRRWRSPANLKSIRRLIYFSTRFRRSPGLSDAVGYDRVAAAVQLGVIECRRRVVSEASVLLFEARRSRSATGDGLFLPGSLHRLSPIFSLRLPRIAGRKWLPSIRVCEKGLSYDRNSWTDQALSG